MTRYKPIHNSHFSDIQSPSIWLAPGAPKHTKTAIYPLRVNVASYSRRSTFGWVRGISASPSGVPRVLRLESICKDWEARAALKRQISLPREPSPWQPLLLDSSAVR